MDFRFNHLKIPYTFLTCLLFVFSIGIYLYLYAPYYKKSSFLQEKYFYYTIVTDNYKNEFQSVLKGMEKYNSCTIIDFFSMKYDIVLDRKISYYDILLRGNFGKNGTQRMIQNVRSSKNSCYLVTKSTYQNRSYISQMDYDIIDYICNQLTKVEETEYYEVYYQK